jgi:hypothetical protein
VRPVVLRDHQAANHISAGGDESEEKGLDQRGYPLWRISMMSPSLTM